MRRIQPTGGGGLSRQEQTNKLTKHEERSRNYRGATLRDVCVCVSVSHLLVCKYSFVKFSANNYVSYKIFLPFTQKVNFSSPIELSAKRYEKSIWL